jgi:hypothetical protein
MFAAGRRETSADKIGRHFFNDCSATVHFLPVSSISPL